MKKIKRFAAVLLAGIMALALFTACSDSDPGNPEFDPKVESAYQKALNNTFGTSFENDADIKRLAIEHIEEKHGADSLTGETLWKTKGDGKTVVRQVMLCWELKKDTGKGYVPLFYEAAKTAGFGAEIAARVAEECLFDLLAPVERVTGYDTHIPLFRLEMKYLPSTDKIVAAAKRAMAYS